MEDRITPGVYLEMTNADPAAYARGRVDEVLAVPGARRATWWENVAPGRTDLPRRIEELRVLGAYEVDDAFVAPVAPSGVRAHHFRHCPRPGQGRLTGRPTVGLSVVLISPREPGQAQALRDWADFVHIRHIAEVAVPGYSMITPYENVTGGDPRFLHWYEMDTDDPEASFAAMAPLVQRLLGEPGTPAYDHWARHPALRIVYVGTFRRIGERSPV